MDEVSRILGAIEAGDPKAAAELLPLVYDELRKLAAVKLSNETPGQTLQATALVHEAYLRLLGGQPPQGWDGRGHFFAAAAEAMRRILVENARRKRNAKNGGGMNRLSLEEGIASEPTDDDLLAFDEALERLARVDPQAAEFVKLRYFSGLTTEEAGAMMGIPERSAYRLWAFAKAWLYRDLNGDGAGPS
ncbi:MAG: ECF-type sigma factor [Isosphaeraceae bacterium]